MMRLPISARLVASMLVVATVATPAVSLAQEVGEKEGDVRDRIEWMLRDRGYPFGEVDRNPVFIARNSALFRSAASSLSSLAVPAWRSIGPFGFQTSGYYGSSPQADGGRITSIAIDPRTPSTVYAGSASGGVWRTSNGGASWTSLTDAQCSLTTGAIAIDPTDPTILYVGTGEPTQSSGCGLLRSFDSGASWTEINGAGVLAPTNGTRANQSYRIAIDRASAGSRTSTIVLYAASNGLHRSANSGTTWTTVLPGFVSDVRADPTNTSVFWAAVGNSNARGGLWKSTDRGVTWTQVYIVPASSGRVALSVSRVTPGRVWIAMSATQGNKLNALVSYDDVSGNATVLPAIGIEDGTTRLDFGSQTSYNLVLEADPTDANTVYLGGSRMYRSRNGGQSFSLVAYNVHVDWHAFEFAPSDPAVIVGGCDGGVHASYDGGNAWISRNTNIVVSQFYPGLAVHPSIPDVLIGGLQDNSTLWAFGSPYWTLAVASGDGGAGAFNPTNPDVMWSTSYGAGTIYRIVKSAVGYGVSAFNRGFSVSGTERKRFLSPLVIDPTNGAILYYGTYRVWRTINEGVSGSWTPVSADLTKGTGVINTIDVAASDSRVVWVGTSDGNVQLSIDAGATYTLVTSGLPNRAVTRIAADPLDAKRALLTYSGFGTPHVFLTTDQGVSWKNVSSNLPDLPFNSAVIIPGTDRFFVAADVGIYESVDAGGSWSSAYPGMPNVQVLDLVFQRATGQLYAGTYGRGIYSTSVLAGQTALRGDVNRDGVVNGLDALQAQQALVGSLPSSAGNPMPAADANCNGRLDIGDALVILQFAVGNAPAGSCVGTVR